MSKRRKTRPKNISQTLPLEGAFPNYLSDVSDDLSQKYYYVEDIKSGKTGLTCKISNIQNQNVFYCLKTIKPEIKDKEVRRRIKT